MIKILAISYLTLISTAVAQDRTVYVVPRPVSEAEKIWALKAAYLLNGNSMVGYGHSIDLTDRFRQLSLPKGDKLK